MCKTTAADACREFLLEHFGGDTFEDFHSYLMNYKQSKIVIACQPVH